MAGKGLLERLAEGPVICAEGYLFELERRGYVQAGPYVPEVVLDAPDAVRQLHREFVRAGSDVVEAFTYYGHREKLKIIGKEDVLEPLNRQALQIAKEVADESGALLAGDLSNT
ncbi:MAG: homocysteine S-methyltransferase family protein, partial [Geminicoccaceae bacterium]